MDDPSDDHRDDPPDDPSHLLGASVDASFEAAQVPFLRRLVQQPSCSREPEDVEAAAGLLDAEAEALGLSRELHEPTEGPYADHRVYSTEAASTADAKCDDRALLLVGHVDTVFPRSEGFLEFSRDGDVIRGPGVLDMKSGLSSVLFALRALGAVDPAARRALRVRFLVTTDEEVGSPSSRSLIQREANRASAALVFEAGRDEDLIVTHRKGTAFFRVTVTGHAVHAGLHHREGKNAIHALALLVPRLEAITDYDRGVTVNVGLIRGGTSKNTVPGHATAELDLRFERSVDGDEAIAQIEDALRFTLPPSLEGCTLRLEGGVSRPPMEPSDHTNALRRRYERHAGEAGLGVGEAPLQGGGSDANILSAAGVAVIDGLGPYGKRFHTPEEWSSLDSLRRRTRALAGFLYEVAKG